MSKKNKANRVQNVNGNDAVKKERKPIVIDNAKKEKAVNIINTMITDATFPKLVKVQTDLIASTFKVNEKTIAAFAVRLQKFVETISRGKKIKKGKEVSEDINKQIVEISSETANRMSNKLLKSPVIFKELIILKKTKDGNAYGKAIFTLKSNQKEYFLCWDYKMEDLFVGSTLHEYTDEIKASQFKKKEKKEKV